MADNNIKIKLTADGKQARSEIKLIDQDLKKLNQSRVTDDKKDNGGTTSASTPHVNDNLDKKATEQQKKSNDINTRILREMTLLRKELIRLNMNNSHTQSQSSGSTQQSNNAQQSTTAQGGSSGGGGNNQPPYSKDNKQPNNPSPNPSPNNDNQPNSPLNVLGGKLGKLALAIGSFSMLRSVYNKTMGYAQSAENAESLAYKTYGTTLWYDGKNGYDQARRDTSHLGDEYGYSMQESMGVVEAIKDNAGLTTKENLASDADAIMSTSKAFNVDTRSLAHTVSTADRLGIVKQGDYRKLTDVFAEGIVQSGMIDRADEQIQANQSIIDTLSSKTSRLSEDGMLNALQAQVALSQQNSALKGQSGASMVNAIASTASSNNDLKLLLGLGTDKYSGVEGELALERLINKDAIGATRQGLQNFLGYDVNKHILDKIKGMSNEELDLFVKGNEDRSIKGDEQLSGFISMMIKNTGKDADTVTDYVISELKNIRDGKSGSDLKNTSNGKEVIDKNLGNYNESKVSIQEKKKVNEERAEQNVGDWANRFFAPFRDWYNGLSDGQRTALKVGGLALGGAGGIGGLYSSFKGAKGIWNSAKDLFKWGNGAKTVADTAKEASATAKGANATAKGAETVANATKTASKLAKLSTVAKGAGLAGAVIDTGVTAVNVADAIDKGDNREASQEASGLAGRLAGAWLGAKLGATGGASVGTAVGGPVGTGVGGLLGGLAGGFGGLFLGDKVGQFLGETGYDVFGNGEQLTDEQKQEVSKYYNRVNEIYQTQGSSEAKDYVNKEVVPYLSKIGVSKSYTDAYDFDWGENDFLEDVREGVYGADVLPKEYMYVDEDGSKKSKGDLWEAYINNHNEVPKTAVQEQAHTVKDIENPIVEAIENTATPTATPTANTAVESVSIPKDTTSTTSSSDTAVDNNTDAINRNTVAINSLLLKNASVPNGALDDVFLSDILKGHTSEEQLQTLIEKDPTSVTVPKETVSEEQLQALIEKDPIDADTVTDYVISELKNIRDGKSGSDLKNTSNGKEVIDKNLGNYSVTVPKETVSTNAPTASENTALQKSIQDNTRAIENTVNTALLENDGVPTMLQVQAPNLVNATADEEDNGLFSSIMNLFKSHAVGNDYVPYDNYLASLHKGEMVLTKMEADKYRQGATNAPQSTTANGTMSLNINISGAVDGMTPTNQEHIVQAIVAKISSMSGLQGMLSNGFTRIQNV